MIHKNQTKRPLVECGPGQDHAQDNQVHIVLANCHPNQKEKKTLWHSRKLFCDKIQIKSNFNYVKLNTKAQKGQFSCINKTAYQA